MAVSEQWTKRGMRSAARQTSGVAGFRIFAVFAMTWVGATSAATTRAAERPQYNRDIRPILVEHCFSCHGPDESSLEAGLRLDKRAEATIDAIVAGKPEESPLIWRVRSDDVDEVMPPPAFGKPLDEQQKQLLEAWIAEGAAYADHWAFLPIEKAEVPESVAPEPVAPEAVAGAADQTRTTSMPLKVARTEIDHFIELTLREHGLSLSPVISREQWIRRVTFDLIGLPPSWEEVQSFVADESSDACAKVVDRLLESPRYGERWARHWLDIARYADTHGGSAIGFTQFPFSYTYRDYVIGAFNADLPYDRFVMEQIAADQLETGDAEPGENDASLAALGFLTVGMQFRNRHDVVDDQIDVVSRGLMGLTVACARCHDHKYDPIPTDDYYKFYATFASSSVPDELPVIGDSSDPNAQRGYQAELQRLQVQHRDMQRDQTEVMRGRLRMQVGLYLSEIAKGATEQDLAAVFLSYRTDDIRPLVLNRWLKYLAEQPAEDPVFGPWVQLSRATPEDFATAVKELVTRLRGENGDPAKFGDMRLLGSVPPRWNPRVLDALDAVEIKGLEDVARAYGELFADVHRKWLEAQLAAAVEASPGQAIVTDQDPRHTVINSAIEQQLRRHLYEPGTPTAIEDGLAATLLNRTVRDTLNGKGGGIHGLHLNSAGSPPRAMVLSESEDAGPFFVFRRGNPIDRGEVVRAGFLDVLADQVPVAEEFRAGGRRRALAEAIVNPENPLTRRVLVNWVWQHHFGQGLVATPDDFGARSRPPSHPELLDYLANCFAEDGWSIKALHRRIVLSRTYAQAASENRAAREIDAENRWLWRMPRRRLDMEAMRDAMLSVSGELDTSRIGGRPFALEASPVVPRRTVYGMVNRDVLASLATTFDRADPSSCTAKREETTVPQQTLFALNSDFIQDRAASFAARTAMIADARERIRQMYRDAFAREPREAEWQAALEFVSGPVGQGSPEAWQQFAHVLLAANEFVFVD